MPVSDYRSSHPTTLPLSYLVGGTLISLLVHALVFSWVVFQPAPTVSTPKVFKVNILPPAEAPPFQTSSKQIVSPSESTTSDTPPKESRFLSDRDSVVEREQIKRGDGLETGPTLGKGGVAAPPPAKPVPQRNTTVPRPRETKKPPAKDLKYLALDPKTVAKEFAMKRNLTDELKAGGNTELFNPRTYRPFSRNSGSGARFLGARGASDYLPDLPDGDITLLNAKASKFAVFVRRVGTQVFQHLRMSGWESLTQADIRALSDYATIRAVLSPTGDLLKVVLEYSSGSDRFDSVLEGAVRTGAHDPNPPQDALAKDGNIHFIFKAKSWSATASRGKFPVEKRWLMLGTGLE